MKRVISLAVFLLLFAAIAAVAKEVDPDRAFRIASGFVSNRDALRSASSLRLVYKAVVRTDSGLRADGSPLFYIYNVEHEGGFVMISGDDRTLPIFAYSDNGRFQADSMPDNLKNWLKFYENEISSAIARSTAPSAEIRKAWDELSDGTVRTASPIVLLPTAAWDQTMPYNNLCPVDSGERALAGCVATAMGILMKYHQWPEKGKGSNAYITPSRQISLSADFNVAYDWANMPDTYSRRWTLEQENAVATLIYHCGVAANMDYTRDGSGTTSWDAANALTTCFGYDKGACMVYRNLYTAAEWDDLIQQELNERRPLLYGGATKNDEGHLFIVDGYNSQNYYHINWGWSGLANGYYLLSSPEPQWQGAGGSKDGEGYAFEQDAIIGLKKTTNSRSLPNHEFYFLEDNVLDEELFQTYGLSTDAEMITPGKPFKLRFSFIFDYGRRDFDGNMGFFVADANGKRKIELEVFPNTLEANYVLYDNEGETYTITEEVEKGDKIRMYYNSIGNEWKPVRGTGKTVVELPVGVPIETPVEDPVETPVEDPVEEPPITSLEPLTETPAASVQISVSRDGSAVEILSAEDDPLKTVRLFDLSGRLTEEATPSRSGGTRLLFPVNHPPGIYILSVQTARGRSEHKIIKR
jgi:hypothetical protein